ncbi:MAG: hypothetical protein JSV56_12995 [Methanomassiliicoccales archaeon]|nr:MAG: hypothetical protein JSV56_12995 [Methanomassiliicoccales archaeon]
MGLVKLRKIAHARSGDKGDILNISLIPYDEKDYTILKENVTAHRVKEHFGDLLKGEVKRYDLDNIKAFNFVLYDALSGGVTQSLRLDKHGKTLSFLLLDMEVEI